MGYTSAFQLAIVVPKWSSIRMGTSSGRGSIGQSPAEPVRPSRLAVRRVTRLGRARRAARWALVQRAHRTADQIGQQLAVVLVEEPEVAAVPARKVHVPDEKESRQRPLVEPRLCRSIIDPAYDHRPGEHAVRVERFVGVGQDANEGGELLGVLLEVAEEQRLHALHVGAPVGDRRLHIREPLAATGHRGEQGDQGGGSGCTGRRAHRVRTLSRDPP